MSSTQTNSARDDFSSKTITSLKMRAAFICSNPECRTMTISPAENNSDGVEYIGTAAHIKAASPEGPRYDPSQTVEERVNIENAIFLCRNCATAIDNNKGIDYSVDLLHKWKKDHESWVKTSLNKTLAGEGAVNVISSQNQSGGMVASIINVNNYGITQTNESVIHDIAVFQKSDAILSEAQIWEIMDDLVGDESIRYSEIIAIDRYISYNQQSSNEYLNASIEASRIAMIDALIALMKFEGVNYFCFPDLQPAGSDTRYCMQPDLNIDRRGTGKMEDLIKHSNLQQNLKQLYDVFAAAYKVFRKTIKSNLMI